MDVSARDTVGVAVVVEAPAACTACRSGRKCGRSVVNVAASLLLQLPPLRRRYPHLPYKFCLLQHRRGRLFPLVGRQLRIEPGERVAQRGVQHDLSEIVAHCAGLTGGDVCATSDLPKSASQSRAACSTWASVRVVRGRVCFPIQPSHYRLCAFSNAHDSVQLFCNFRIYLIFRHIIRQFIKVFLIHQIRQS